jgi:hypothetical protein
MTDIFRQPRASAYVCQKLYQAAGALNSNRNSIQQRLAFAGEYLLHLIPFLEQIPEKQRAEFAAIYQELTCKEAVGDEGSINATASQLTDQEASSLAARILSLYDVMGGL